MKSVLCSTNVTPTDQSESRCGSNYDATVEQTCTEKLELEYVRHEFFTPISSHRSPTSYKCRCFKIYGCNCGNRPVTLNNLVQEIVQSTVTSRSSIFEREDNFPREPITLFISAFWLQPCPWISLSEEILLKAKKLVAQRETINSGRTRMSVKEGNYMRKTSSSYRKELSNANICHVSHSACLKNTFKRSDTYKHVWCPQLCEKGHLFKFLRRDVPRFSKSTCISFVRLLFSCLLITTMFPNVRLAEAIHHGNAKRHLSQTITMPCKRFPITLSSNGSYIVPRYNKTMQIFCDEHREVLRDKNHMLQKCAEKNHSKCCEPVKDILETDYNLSRSYNTFLLTITKYATPHNYSVNWSIEHCKDTYKKWICAAGHKVYDSSKVHNKSREMEASNCLQVWAQCPFFRVHNHTKLYGGQSAFLCTGFQSPESPKWEDCQSRPGKLLPTSSILVTSATKYQSAVSSIFTSITSTPWTFINTSQQLNITAFDLSDRLTTSVTNASRRCFYSPVYFLMSLIILILCIQFFKIPYI